MGCGIYNVALWVSVTALIEEFFIFLGKGVPAHVCIVHPDLDVCNQCVQIIEDLLKSKKAEADAAGGEGEAGEAAAASAEMKTFSFDPELGHHEDEDPTAAERSSERKKRKPENLAREVQEEALQKKALKDAIRDAKLDDEEERRSAEESSQNTKTNAEGAKGLTGLAACLEMCRGDNSLERGAGKP